MFTSLFTAILAFTAGAIAVDATVDSSLDASLLTAATHLDRAALLPTNKDWLFDFKAQDKYSYSPGSVINANAATFPALAGLGMTLAMLNLGPCAMLPPHFHPRATNLVVAVEGTTNTYMIEENGARVVSETLTPGKMTIFPHGSLHSMQNTGCGNATLVSALDSDDTGTTNFVNNLFSGGIPADLVRAAFGNPATGTPAGDFLADFGKIASSIPGVGTGSILGSAECLAACKKGSEQSGYTGTVDTTQIS